MENNSEILSLNIVAEVLDYKNRRSVLRWCLNNKVILITHIGSRRKYVNKKQFYYAFYGMDKKIEKNSDMKDKIITRQENHVRRNNVNAFSEIDYIEYYKSRLLRKHNTL